MATIRALEGRTVHQIQSGQVIIDLCSVVKELVENSLDAGATSIEVRFRNHGLDAVEVQDNGVGISSENYESIALKHYTSKLSSYDDLTSLQTFGFRGEALSSLCALSEFHVLTARAEDAPKGTRLDFEASGKLKGIQVAACQKGTTVTVENLFINLPVRRRELEKNIKREYSKVLGILQAYACITTNARFSVSNLMAKGNKIVVFATKSNPTTRENIANVYGAKALSGLISMDLSLEMQAKGASAQEFSPHVDPEDKRVHVLGHVSRPIFGEGRQAPDRQMFFVNSRPCGLPQVAKVFNEVYKSYNLSQSPFVFANIKLNTNAYDVNVSPDKRTILLHDQGIFLDSLKRSLTTLFEQQDQTVPQSRHHTQKLTLFKPVNIDGETSQTEKSNITDERSVRDQQKPPTREINKTRSIESDTGPRDTLAINLIEEFLDRGIQERTRLPVNNSSERSNDDLSSDKRKLVKKIGKESVIGQIADGNEDYRDGVLSSSLPVSYTKNIPIPVVDFNQRIAEQQRLTQQYSVEPQETVGSESEEVSSVSSEERCSPPHAVSVTVQKAFETMRPKRKPTETATITIGSKTTTEIIGSSISKRQKTSSGRFEAPHSQRNVDSSVQEFGSSMRAFAAPGTQAQTITSSQADGSGLYRQPSVEPLDVGSEDEASEAGTPSRNEAHRQETGGALLGCLQGTEDEATEPSESDPGEDSTGEFLDEEHEKMEEVTRVAKLIRQAEQRLATPPENQGQRARWISKGDGQNDTTIHLTQIINTSRSQLSEQLKVLVRTAIEAQPENVVEPTISPAEDSPETRLSLTVSKEDFSRMHIVGQFNLGFILTTRFGKPLRKDPFARFTDDELFIIDQHASDEKYNFERLQSSTIVQNQPLVKPHTLDLTAIEEEIIMENNDVLLKNGFVVSIDSSGDEPVGRRCKLLSLPMSREVTFDTADLEELIALLADSPSLPSRTTQSTSIHCNTPRPSKVRRMFAMRACRSSIMIGKSLPRRRMEKLVKHMGEIDKPWNCPHGRPTMRHVLGLRNWGGWKEGMGDEGEQGKNVNWKGWAQNIQEDQQEDEDDDDDDKAENKDVIGDEADNDQSEDELEIEGLERD